VRIACEIAGVGVYSSPAASMTSTPFAASTSSALVAAGFESACVSMPRKSGPSMPCAWRWAQMAWLIASTCASLNELVSDEPRWPEVPKATRCAAIDGSGTRSK
jgi:hypothetical protein